MVRNSKLLAMESHISLFEYYASCLLLLHDGVVGVAWKYNVVCCDKTFSCSGSTGATGLPGGIGASGSTGQPGPVGGSGPPGPNGSTGSAGATGSTGPLGPTGPTGPQGSQGSTGSSGLPGISGATGRSEVSRNKFDMLRNSMSQCLCCIHSFYKLYIII